MSRAIKGIPERVRDAWDRGLHVVPRPRDGRFVPWAEFKTRPPTREEMVRFGRDYPDACWQFVCGQPGYVVLDFDDKNGHSGSETMRRLGLKPNVATPSGGSHVYVEPPGWPVRSRTPVDPDRWPGLDLLGEAHLATFYGLRDGGEYRLLRQRFYKPQELPTEVQNLLATRRIEERPELVVPLPEGFDDFLAARALLKEALARVNDGYGRNDTCLWLGCQLRDERCPNDEALQALFKYADQVSGLKADPFTRAEAYGIWMRVLAEPARAPRRLLMLAFKYTDGGNAKRLVVVHGDDLLYCAPTGRWHCWDGTRWREDDTLEIARRAKDITRRMYADAARLEDEDARKHLARHAHNSDSRNRLAGMVDVARSEPTIPVRMDEFDRDALLLNISNGTIDLRSGTLRPHARGDRLSKLAPVSLDASAEAPTWSAFLGTVLPDADDRAFLQRAVGYSLTGDTSEECFFLLHGSGANGKSTLLETLRGVFGDYAQQAPSELLMTKQKGAIPSDVARLRGARFVTAIETDEGERMAEALVKQITTGDRIAARFMHQDFFEFTPQAKLWLATNHKPVVRGTDDAIWRRIRLIPFTMQIPEADRDRRLRSKLMKESPGILNWALAGLQAWRRDGLGSTANIFAATNEYRQEQDTFGAFLEDACVLTPDLQAKTADLFAEYLSWCDEANLRYTMDSTGFSRRLGERGFTRVKIGKRRDRGWKGIGLRRVQESPAARRLAAVARGR